MFVPAFAGLGAPHWDGFARGTMELLVMGAAGPDAGTRTVTFDDFQPIQAGGLPIALQRHDDVDLQRVMSNSFGFGGTNASLVFQKYSA